MNIELKITRSSGEFHYDPKLNKRVHSTALEKHYVDSPSQLQTLVRGLFGEPCDDIHRMFYFVASGRQESLTDGPDQNLFVVFSIADRESALHTDMVASYRSLGYAELPGDLTHLRRGDSVPGYPELEVRSAVVCKDSAHGVEEEQCLYTLIFVK